MKINYGPLDKFLHHIVLSNHTISEILFDIESFLANRRAIPQSGPHVFITGLARAGTTAFLNLLYSSGKFRSLRYENMPFILAPSIWKHTFSTVESTKIARAHDDGILINSKSPEAFDEVFWKNFTSSYITENGRIRFVIDDAELTTKYKQFIHNYLSIYRTPPYRYLSKNNNSIVRLNLLKNPMIDSRIILVIRPPDKHAQSLHTMHLIFCKMQDDDPFIKKYMEYIGHYEFGKQHKPFNFEFNSTRDINDVNYWLEYWIAYHKCIFNNIKYIDFILLNHDINSIKKSTWGKLSQIININTDGLIRKTVPQNNIINHSVFDTQILSEAEYLYKHMVEYSNTY